MSADLMKLTHVILRVAVMRHGDTVLNHERGRLLPEDTCLAIRHHHALGALDGSIELPESSRRLIAVAQLAEYLVQTHTAQSLTSEWEKLGADCLACLELSPDDLPEIGAVCATSLAG